MSVFASGGMWPPPPQPNQYSRQTTQAERNAVYQECREFDNLKRYLLRCQIRGLSEMADRQAKRSKTTLDHYDFERDMLNERHQRDIAVADHLRAALQASKPKLQRQKTS
jgi:hypothetical protein